MIVCCRSIWHWQTIEEREKKSVEQHLCNSTDLSAGLRVNLILLSGVNSFLSVTAFLGNALILIALRKESSLHPPSKLLLRCLATTDLCVGLITEPLFVTVWMSMVNEHWNICVYVDAVGFRTSFILTGVSLWTMTATSVDRLLAIQKPLHYPSIVTIPRVTRVVVAVWIFCVVLASAQFLHERIQLVSAGAVVCVCLFISAFSHAKIYKIVRHHQHFIQMQLQAVEANAPNTGNVNNMSGLKRSVLNALIVLLVLIVCYSPYIVVDVVSLVYPINLFLCSSLASTAVFINSALNPFLYCWRIYEIREIVKQTCHKLVCFK